MNRVEVVEEKEKGEDSTFLFSKVRISGRINN
jgi:hypothetical protein